MQDQFHKLSNSRRITIKLITWNRFK